MLDVHRIVTDACLSRTLGSFGENVSGALLRMPLVLVRRVLDLIHLERNRVERLRDSEKSDSRADVFRELDSMLDRPVRQLRAVRRNEKMLEHDMPPLAAHQVTATKRQALPDLMAAAAVIQCTIIVRQQHQNVRKIRLGLVAIEASPSSPTILSAGRPGSDLDALVGPFGRHDGCRCRSAPATPRHGPPVLYKRRSSKKPAWPFKGCGVAVPGLLKGDTCMSHLAALMGFLVLAMSPAWAQTPPATPGSPPAGDAAATGGGIADYWWVILLVIIIAAAIWYFSRRSSRV